MRWLVALLWWLLAVVVLTGGGIFAFLAVSNTNAIDLPTPTSAPSAPADVDAKLDTSYFVLVLNGTPEASLADAVQQQVVGAGWAADDVAVLDSDATDFATTTVFYVDKADRAAALGLAKAIGGAEVSQSSEFDKQSEGGLTVVVGLDRTAQ